MNVDELFSQFADEGKGDRCIVDEHPTFSRATDFPSENGVFGIIVDVIVGEKRIHLVVADVEMRLYGTFLSLWQRWQMRGTLSQ